MNKKEFKNLLIKWNQNFSKSVILERGLPHEQLSQFTSSKRGEFNSLRENIPAIFPIMYVTIKSSENNTLFKSVINGIKENQNSDLKLVLQNNKKNRNLVAEKLENAGLIDSIKREEIEQSKDADIIIIPEVGDISSKINKIHVGNTIWSLHDLYHAYLEDSIEFNVNAGFDQNDEYLFYEFVKQALSSKDYPHFFDFEDAIPSVFAFLYLFIIEFDNEANDFNIQKSNQNIDNLAKDLQNFNLSDYVDQSEQPYYISKETFSDVGSLLMLIKEISEGICNLLRKNILNTNKTITLDIVQ
tara:strand:+ start:2778 stop:3677 length:900 start_codon:yes stop_codon:yes gene_type:complete